MTNANAPEINRSHPDVIANTLVEATHIPDTDVLLRRRREGVQALRMHTLSELAGLPKPEYLVDGMLDVGSLAIMYGAPGVGKTFLALDLALHVATGRPWLGRETQHGTVLYVAAEGYRSVAHRAFAWLKYYRIDTPPSNLKIVIDPINLMGGDKTAQNFIEQGIYTAMEPSVYAGNSEYGEEDQLVEAPPVKLIVFDTLARCIAGAEENDAKDMGQVIQWVDHLREQSIVASTPTVLLIHHTAKGTTWERGSTVLRGGADTMLYVKADKDGPALACSKQKDHEAFPEQKLLMIKVDDDVLIVPRNHQKPSAPPPEEVKALIVRDLGERQAEALRHIASTGDIMIGITMKEITDPICEKNGITMPAVYMSVKKLEEKGFVRQFNDERPARYIMTDEGWAALAALKEQEHKALIEPIV